ncbi:DUF4123 domain-containing protein [Herbaspirillum sp. DW155]|uniref:DUF4123 domain-containing protein n=1 Tax=Herbaspirillum sp. DW155 TaxID=3095609 RepID=UPI0030857D74|nr:DUF4123 domain-containing protein [Herbaspirillum sp. DW155]
MSEDIFGLLHWSDCCIERRHYAYLLIDGALNEGQHRRLQVMGIRFTSLFEGTAEEHLPDVAPWLIELTGLALPQRQRLIQWASVLARKLPCLSWYESSGAIDDFARHLRHFHCVGLSDHQTMLMRWYDTRILPVWMEVLTGPQRALFTRGMQSVACVDADGAVRDLYASPTGQASGAAGVPDMPMLMLDDRQFALLLEARALDTLIHEIGLRAPGRWHRIAQARKLDFVARHRDAALCAGVKDSERQLYYVLLAVFTSGKAAQHPAVMALMQAPPEALPDFIDAIRQLPGEVFLTGEPLWMTEPIEDEAGGMA